MTNNRKLRETVRVTKALADAQRLRILMLLRPGELCVCQIVEVLALAPSTISKHLSLLYGAGLIETRKQGRWAYYRLALDQGNEFARPALDWLEQMLKDDEIGEKDAAALKNVLARDPAALCKKQQPGKIAS